MARHERVIVMLRHRRAGHSIRGGGGETPRLLRSCLQAILEADKEEDENGQFHEEV